MAAATGKAARAANTESGRLQIADLVLIRIAAGGANRAELQRDLAPLLAPAVSGTHFRRSAELAIGHQTGANLVTESRGKIGATGAGQQAAARLAGCERVARETWDDVRNVVLVALALGLNAESPSIVKALGRPEGLAALILQTHFGLGSARVLSVTDLRTALAVIALEKAFGNKIKTGLSKGSGLPGKTARLLAGQLFRKPRDVASDGKLVTALAAEVAGAPNDQIDALRLALLRRLTQPADAPDEAIAREPDQRVRPRAQPKAANDVTPLTVPPPKISPPDMSEFVSSVLDAARPVSEGWPGNRKAFISRVWQAIRSVRREWDLTEIAFKSMLAEAHRCGQLVLATADLKDKSKLKDLEESKILYKNTVWHFVRIEE